MNKKISNNVRTINVARNVAISIVCQFITIILGFVCRKAIVSSLGLAYNGVNSLFSSVINLLSFVELGIGNAIVFSLYKPIAEKNEDLITKLITYFEKMYLLIAILVFVIGCAIIPFLGFFVNADDGIKENITVMYILTLASTSCTYLFASRKTLLIADQRQYVEKIIYQICHILQVILQILVLFVLKNYYLFLIIQIISNLSNNLIATFVSNKNYPFLKNYTNKLESQYVKSIYSDVGATMFYKVGTSFLNYIDSLFVSYFCGLVILGKISNYLLILSTLAALISQITNALSASVGNKNVVDSKENVDKSYFDSLFLVCWFAGLFLLCFLFLSTPFIAIVFGEECILSFDVVLSMGLLYFITGIHSVSATYRYSIGVFKKGRFSPLVASFLNVILSYLLYLLIGIPGLYVSTIIARIVTMGIIDPYYILGGKKGVLKYYCSIFKFIAPTFIMAIVFYVIFSFINVTTPFMWLLCSIFIIVCFNLFSCVVFFKSRHFHNLIRYIKVVIKR